MIKLNLLWIGIFSGITLATFAASSNPQVLSFDTDHRFPTGWQAGATGGKIADWQVVSDPRAPSPPNVLSITRFNDTSDGIFNLFWSPEVPFRNGTIEVKIRANSGTVDQGGGLIWRAQNSDNYYIARYNPLENNLRLYYVKNARRTLLIDVPNLKVGSNEWFTLKVVHHGTRIEAWLNNKKLIEITDATFTNAGGIGFWTKADANSAFDNLKVQQEN